MARFYFGDVQRHNPFFKFVSLLKFIEVGGATPPVAIAHTGLFLVTTSTEGM